jgi:hypothetical protein
MSESVVGRVKQHNRRPPAAGKGRPVGALNVINRDIKEMILGALSDVGGRAYLAEQAVRNPNAFMGLVGKILPYQIAGHDGGAFVIRLAPLDSSDAIASPTAPAVQMIEGRVVDAVEVADDRVAPPDRGEIGEVE